MTVDFTGTGVALVTPFHTDNSVDFDALEKVVRHTLEGGVEYLVVLGTTGETATLRKDEKNKVVASVVKSVNNRVPVIIGIGGYDTADVIETIQSSNLEGISAILSVSPYYNKPSQRGLYEHFSAIAKISPLPLIIYNVPGRTSTNINAETTLKLAKDHTNIIGVKEASGNFTQIMQILKDKPAHFEVISGDDALTLPMICLGAKGVISVIANSHPRQYSDMVRAALRKEYEIASSLHFKLLDCIGVLFEEGSPTGVKAALELLGICTKTVRLPLVSASEALMIKIDKILKEIA
jgi:4-hydroxy-tetrahydrodipicolinate synthase